ncbi:MAG: tetratricopeptide repeat protein [Nitrospirota bacterium]|nr:tetratricopeptide repeat protein [Nitrospirota bacterium]MDP2381378.1 tetratricopeptide repeat protein [Nitrospirota bacterium]MDP3596879.1 tetratricopeptide repeat protein [Nitrospirota bacterium]
MKEFDPSPLKQEQSPASFPILSGTDSLVTMPGISNQSVEAADSIDPSDGHESYERGTALKNVGLFRQAAEHYEKAAQHPRYALKGFAQMGLCLKKSGKQDDAVEAFRRALQVPSTSLKERVQILYLLGRTLESLGRIPESMETYRWLRREAPQYRDVAMRIESLSTRRMPANNRLT